MLKWVIQILITVMMIWAIQYSMEVINKIILIIIVMQMVNIINKNYNDYLDIDIVEESDEMFLPIEDVKN